MSAPKKSQNVRMRNDKNSGGTIVSKARALAESIIATVRQPLLMLDADLKIISGNKAFYQAFKVNPEETIGQFIYDLGNRQWNIPKLRQLLEEILPKNYTIENYEVEHDFEAIGSKTMLLNARDDVSKFGT